MNREKRQSDQQEQQIRQRDSEKQDGKPREIVYDPRAKRDRPRTAHVRPVRLVPPVEIPPPVYVTAGVPALPPQPLPQPPEQPAAAGRKPQAEPE